MSRLLPMLVALVAAPAPSNALIGQSPFTLLGSEQALGHALSQLPALAAPVLGSATLVGAGVAAALGLREASDASSGSSGIMPTASSSSSRGLASLDDDSKLWGSPDLAAVHVEREWGEYQRESAVISALARGNKVDECVLRLDAMLRSSGDDPAVSTCNAVLFALARAERPDDAADLLARLSCANTASHNALMHAYARARRCDDALRVFSDLSARGEADIVSYGCAMNACARAGDVTGCEDLHAQLLAERATRREGVSANVRLAAVAAASAVLAPNEFTYGALVHACAEAAARARARGDDDSAARATAVRYFEAGRAEAFGAASSERGGQAAEERFVRKMIQLHDGRLHRALSKRAPAGARSAASAWGAAGSSAASSALPFRGGLVGAHTSGGVSVASSAMVPRPRLQSALAAEDGHGSGGGDRSERDRRTSARRRKGAGRGARSAVAAAGGGDHGRRRSRR